MNEHFKDLLSDNSEILLDSLINNEILKEIPVLGSSLKIIRGVMNVRDKAYLNKIEAFIECIGEISEENKLKLISKSKEDQQSRVKFGDAIFTTIEQSDSLVKVEYLAIAFEAFLNEDFGESSLRLICHIIRNSFTDDLIYIIENENPRGSLEHLVASGLAEMEFRELTSDMTKTEPKYHLTAASIWIRAEWRKYKNA